MPVLTGRQGLALLGAGMAVVLTGGCSSAVAGSTPGSSAAQVVSSCSIYDSGADARVLVRGGGATAECGQLARDLSGGGSFWTLQSQAPQAPLSVVCIMTSSGFTATVEDDGGQIIGQGTCSGFEQAGWTEDAAAEQRQAQAAASASAAASAQAAVQQQDSDDEQDAQSDLASLREDASTGPDSSIGGDLASFASDAKQAAADLTQTRHDAAGSDSYCEVAIDAAGDADDVDGDLDDISGDIDDLQSDLSTVRDDIRALRADLSRLNDDGLTAPGGAAAAISAGRAAIRQADTTADSYISAGNTDDAEAYAAADAAATGECSGDGPGTPTKPLPLLG